MAQDKNEIVRGVKSVISQALKVAEDEIDLGSSLIKDLGAESIDFLDIVFRLEKTFKIKIPKGELFPEKILTDARFVKEGRVTSEGISALRQAIPSADWEAFSTNPLVADLGEVFTVGMIVDYLSDKLAMVKP